MLSPLLFALSVLSAPLELGQQKELFLDDDFIESMDNVTRVVQRAEPHPSNPVLWPEAAWEGKVSILYGSVLREGDRLRMWYHADHGVGYAESADGVRWDRPLLGLHQVDGADTNLVILRNAEDGAANRLRYFYELFGVLRDDREPDPAKRYKMGFLSLQPDYTGPNEGAFHAGQRRGLGVAVSPDGIHWNTENDWATRAICDGGTYWMWDPAREQYVLYGRTKFIAPEVKAAWAEDAWSQKQMWGRSVARVTSPDFLHWDMQLPQDPPVVMTSDVQDAPGTEIYSMMVFPYGNAYVGLVQNFHNRPDDTRLYIELAGSRDTGRFQRVGDRSAFIPNGDVGAWDRFNTSVANNPPIQMGDELWFYYGGRTYRHSPYSGPDKGLSGGGIGIARIKQDRFVALQASFDGGVLTTRPLHMAGAELHLNCTSLFGAIIVEVLDENGEVLAVSEAVRAESLDTNVHWKDGAWMPATAVRLRIRLENAKLFALWCEK